jgi:hypothetical protein
MALLATRAEAEESRPKVTTAPGSSVVPKEEERRTTNSGVRSTLNLPLTMPPLKTVRRPIVS